VRIFDRYLLREFLLYLVLGLAGFIAVFVVVDVFEKIDKFLDHRASFGLIAGYYLYNTPEIVVRVLPVALLLASFLALGQLNKFGELTAMRAAGQSLLRLLLPVWISALACTAVSLLLSELIVPRANRERDVIYEERIQGIQRAAPVERADVTDLGKGGRIYLVRLYVVPEKRMHQPVLQQFRGGQLVTRVDAAEARWEDRRWVFYNGFRRDFSSGVERIEPFFRLPIDGLDETPADFAKEARQPREMNFIELGRYIDRLRASGSRVANYLVDLHLKLSFPLVNLIVVAIGASLATRLRMQSAALGFGLSMTIAFLYYGLMRTGQALGHNGALQPYVAAWLATAVFGVVGTVMLVRAQRR
jgi:lipopolysaccharide export system permease protein